MPQREHEIFASRPMQGLLAAESAALAPDLQRRASGYALQLSAADGDAPATPMLDRWVRLQIAAGRYQGDVVGCTDEPLPFLDDAFGLVLLRHAIEVVAQPSALLREAARVLAPGGLLALTGVHPASAWTPWLLWRCGRGHLQLESPMRVGAWLRAADLCVERVQRLGPVWPSASIAPHQGGPFGGGYLLVARKRRQAALPVRLRPAIIAPAPVGNLAPGARRSAA